MKKRKSEFRLTKEWIQMYGTIALFICQNPDYKNKPCGHIAHADLQAAFNIAVRGYLKYSNPKRARERSEYITDENGRIIKDKGLNRNFLTSEQSKLKFDPINI